MMTAKKYYNQVRGQLEDEGMYDPLTDDLLHVYAQLLSDVGRLTVEIRQTGEIVVGHSGVSTRNPRCILRKQAIELARQYAKSLGIIGRKRARNKPKQQGSLIDFINDLRQ
jgi:phage terminase small subunit